MAKNTIKAPLDEVLKSLKALTETIVTQNILIQEQNEKIQDQKVTIEAHKKVVKDLFNRFSTQNVSVCAPIDITIGKNRQGPTYSAASRKSTNTTPPVMSDRARRAAQRSEKNPPPPPVRQKPRHSSGPAAGVSKTAATDNTSHSPSSQQPALAHDVAPPKAPQQIEIETATEEEPNSNPEGWQIQQTRKRKSKPKVMIGTSGDDGTIKSVERLMFLSAWSFKPDTTEERITAHINSVSKSSDYTVTKRKIKTDRHAAFIIGMPESVYSLINSPTSWPQGIRFSEWFRVRPRGGGERSTDSDARASAAL
ncbi:hypothetical protein O0L34_g19356 [Tuta absoluta]|nr:hypothetical protein O0L34_g19356 [Tuta absoluta]